MPYTNPNTLTLVASTILSANSHWNRVVENVHSAFVTAQGSALGFAVASGITAPGINSFGTLAVVTFNAGKVNANSFLAVRSAQVFGIVQSIFAQREVSDINSTQTFTTYLVASITPVFSDSVIRVRANINGFVQGLGTTPICWGVANLCRDPNGTPVTLSNCNMTSTNSNDVAMPSFAGGSVTANRARNSGTLALLHQESNMAAGTALTYGIRYANLFSQQSGSSVILRGDITVEELR